jgi:CyaY protein
MSESEFLELAGATLDAIEAGLEQAVEDGDVDIECSRSGNVLDIEFIDGGTHIIVNSQAAMQEMWVAAKSGGFHYRHVEGQWRNTRDGSELFAALSDMASGQAGQTLKLAAA